MRIVNAQQMQEIDRRTSQDYGLDAQVLMELAGRCVSNWLLTRCPEGRVAFLCGPGNNGGDGLVAARAWVDQGGRPVVFLMTEDLKADALRNLQRARAWDLDIRPLDEFQPEGFDWYVDSLFGTGLSRPLSLPPVALLPAERTVAVDIPSGVHADTGQILGQAVRAHTTITFGPPKLGQLLAAEHCGQLVIEPIGFPRRQLESDEWPGQWLTPRLARQWLPVRGTTSHKRNTGKVLVVAGSARYPGAGSLAALGALRSGAGLVFSYGPPCIRLPLEAIPLPAKENFLVKADLPALWEHLQEVDALCLGPGLGDQPETRLVVRELLEKNALPAVVDADALRGLPEALSPRVLLTPHAGELGRLLRVKVTELEKDRLRYAVQAARNFNCTVLFKGAATLVATAGGRYAVATEGTPLLAQGGSGDVLSGICAALLSQGLGAMEAGALGAYLQGTAGRQSGVVAGLGAEALASWLPAALTGLYQSELPPVPKVYQSNKFGKSLGDPGRP
ncbi:MAG: NAD(P)H-hydrate dehydratase [Candidatus Eremiobacteraeota bacterium]|nr:NAD(P)H-hydrate dehydratase [Candidatus Eremiobacteraeota bacterium]